jgi:glycerol-3-phosphate dehydrogenase (NAD(P)+)
MRVAVLGAGSWGTALAVHLARIGHEVALWDRNPDRCATMNTARRNPRYLTEIVLPPGLVAVDDLARAVHAADLVVPVVPSHGLGDVLAAAAPSLPAGVPVCVATKGIEEERLETMYELSSRVLGGTGQVSMLYGPSFALEVARGQPTAVVVAGQEAPAHAAAAAFHGDSFRAYHTEDVAGVCIGGSLKNVMAIATGVCDGLGLGNNARAAIITRGLAEITRLAVARGANPLTMMGLAGLGDLVLTCTGALSRNRRVGLALGQGKALDDILAEIGEVAEGVSTARSARQLGQRIGVEMPITEQVHALLFEGKPVTLALRDLLARERRAERD